MTFVLFSSNSFAQQSGSIKTATLRELVNVDNMNELDENISSYAGYAGTLLAGLTVVQEDGFKLAKNDKVMFSVVLGAGDVNEGEKYCLRVKAPIEREDADGTAEIYTARRNYELVFGESTFGAFPYSTNKAKLKNIRANNITSLFSKGDCDSLKTKEVYLPIAWGESEPNLEKEVEFRFNISKLNDVSNVKILSEVDGNQTDCHKLAKDERPERLYYNCICRLKISQLTDNKAVVVSLSFHDDNTRMDITRGFKVYFPGGNG